ncbi:transmembrane protein 183 isoform X3 [Macrobrachium rosenbergii]|uniref:transmembrane protein 183 isoform X3 n=1 Tax=Macrobrachium rosenbergii TaxID=79674 RepID=UPI0034D3B54B
MPRRKHKKEPRPREKGGNGHVQQIPAGRPSPWICQITVNDYANSQKPKMGLSKRTNIRTFVKEHAETLKEDTRAWDEIDDDSDEENFVISYSDGVSAKVQKEKKEQKDEVDIPQFTEYPIDFWFLISEKIQPEDVGRFALICHATYYVVSTARFWFSLYRRNYKWTANLPECLTYHNMDNVRGLKPAVIRSLFYTYSPFSTRIIKEEPLSGHPAKLIGALCVSQWCSQASSSEKFQKYFFIFAKHIKKKRKVHCTQNVQDMPADSLVHFNKDDGCYILETVLSGVCHIPMVMGSYLHNGHLGLSSGFCAHRLQLTFGPAYLLSKNNSGVHHKYLPSTEMSQIVLEPVRDVRIYPWWHPKYEKCLPRLNGDKGNF